MMPTELAQEKSTTGELLAQTGGNESVCLENAVRFRGARGESNRRLQISIAPKRLLRWLIAVVLAMAVSGTLANAMIYHVAPHPEHPLAKVMQRFDLGHEPSVPALYSGMALFACAGLLSLIALQASRERDRFRRHWWLLAVVFAYLAIDEVVMLHEMLDTALSNRLHTEGALHFSWILPAGTFALLLAVAYVPLLRALPRRTATLFVLAGAIFVGGAIGMEIVAGVIAQSKGSEELMVQSWAHTFSQAIEETGEMLGVALFLFALVDYLASRFSSVEIRLVSPSERPAL